KKNAGTKGKTPPAKKESKEERHPPAPKKLASFPVDGKSKPVSPDPKNATNAKRVNDPDADEKAALAKCKFWQDQKSELIYQILKTKSQVRDMIYEHNTMAQKSNISTSIEQVNLLDKTTKLRKKIEDTEKLIPKLEKTMVDLEEKARKDGVPPGCLREIEYPIK
ncbi:MAG: hypothetical protein GY765_34060, partial [bacterium]|nr:hypothetical protein [bacterium]